MHRRAGGSLLSMVLLLLLMPLAGATEPAREWSFGERVDVEVVNVDVYVTDRQGHHVTGLSAADFELYEDGRRVEITNFHAAPPGPEDLSQPLPTAAAPKPRTVAPEQGLLLMVYVDHSNLQPNHRARVIRELGRFLDQGLGPRDQVMLVEFNRSVRVVQPLTTDRRLLAEGLKRMGMTAPHSGPPELDPQATRYLARGNLVESEGMARYSHRSWATRTREARLIHATRALASAVRSFGVQSGRKAVLYVSDGLPARLETFEPQDHLYDHIVDQANAGQVTLYLLDARGPSGGEDFNSQEPLIAMADATGGGALLNAFTHQRSLARMAEDFDHFYSLGFSSSHAGDGNYHRLEVKLRRPDLRVRHRAGYLAKPTAERMADRVLSSLVLDRDDNPLGISLSCGEPEETDGDEFTLPILVQIPTRQVTLVATVGKLEAQLRIFLAVEDEEGLLSQVRDFPYPVSVTADQVNRQGGIGFQTTLEMRAGQYELAVGVWDEISGAQAITRKRVLIGEPPQLPA